MKVRATVAGALISAVAGLAGGYFLIPVAASRVGPKPQVDGKVHGTASTASPAASSSGAAQPASGGAFAERAAFIKRIAAATLADLPALFEATHAQRENRKDYQRYPREIGPVLERWAQLDPTGGAEYLLEKNQGGVASQLFAIWAKLDLEAALDAALAWQPEDQRGQLLPGVLAVLGKVRPAQFRDIIEEHGDGLKSLDRTALTEIFVRLADIDDMGAIALVQKLPRDSQWAASLGIARSLATTDPQGAVVWAMAIDNQDRQGAALRAIAITAAETDPAAAAELIEHFSSKSIYFPAYLIAKKIARTDPEAALEWLFSLKPEDPDSLGSPIGQLFVQELAHEDPHKAFANLIRLVEDFGDKSGNVSNNSFSNFRPEVFPELAAKLDPAATPIEAVGGLAKKWMSHDPAAALTWLADYLPNQTANEARAEFLHDLDWGSTSLLAADFSDQLAALSSRLDADGRQQLAKSFTSTLAQSDDPATQEMFFAQLATSDAEREAFVSARYRHLVRTDPQAALAHLNSPQGEAHREVALKSMATNWASYDPFAASSWAASLEDHAQRDYAAAGLAQTVIRHDTEAALTWLGSIENQQVQSAAIKQTLPRWHTPSITSARQMLDEIEMGADARETILSELDKREAQQQR